MATANMLDTAPTPSRESSCLDQIGQFGHNFGNNGYRRIPLSRDP